MLVPGSSSLDWRRLPADRPATPEVLFAINPLLTPSRSCLHPWHHRLRHARRGVVLAVTGAEALYADLGHFGKRPIQTAWLFHRAAVAGGVNYLGAGAHWSIGDGQGGSKNPFFLMFPDWALLPMVRARHRRNRDRKPRPSSRGAYFADPAGHSARSVAAL